MRFSHTPRRCSGVISSFGGRGFIEGGGGRTSENGLEDGLPEPEGVEEEVSADGLGAADADAAAPDDMGTGTAVPF